MADQGKLIKIEVDQLELDLSNPRHPPFKRPAQVIEYLVLKERVIDLAEDIAKEGTNPMDLLGVVKQKGTGTSHAYIAAEGNRRVCALMLLHDPEKIPAGMAGRAKMIERLEAAARPAHIVPTINVVLFPSKKAAKPWVERMHIRDGRGRRSWSPDQQERAMGGGRNRDAAAILDAALERGMISADERASKLTTVQRYVGNPHMRKTLGIVRDSDRLYWVDRQHADFALLMEAFLEDVRNEKLSSRSDAAAVVRYSDQLLDQTGVVDERVDRVPLSTAFDEILRTKDGRKKDSDETEGDDGEASDDDLEEDENEGIRPRGKIGESAVLETAFAKSRSQKLQSLYLSITILSLRLHCPIITVGFWSLMESLAALHGGDGATFESYFSHDRLQRDFGFTNKDERKNIIASLKRLSEKGNSTKHSAIAASFDGQQVANDFDVLTPLMLAVLSKI